MSMKTGSGALARNPAHGVTGVPSRVPGERPIRRLAGDERTANDDEFAAQVELCYQPLRRMLRLRFGHSISSVDDLARDALAQAWEKRACFDPGRNGLLNWVCGIAKRRAIDELRHYQPEMLSLGDPETEELLAGRVSGPDEMYELGRREELLRRGLKELPDRHRQAVVLHFGEELTLADTARELEISLRQAFTAATAGWKAILRLRQAENRGKCDPDEDSR